MSTKPITMPKPTTLPGFEEHCAKRQSAATEYFDIASEEPAEDYQEIEEQLRKQLHTAQKLMNRMHLEIDDRREINELDAEKVWFLGETIAGCLAKLNDTLVYSDELQNFLERHRELAWKREDKVARRAKRKARRQALLEFVGLASFMADVKKKMGKGKSSLTPDGNDEKAACACCKHDTGNETSAQEKHDNGNKTSTQDKRDAGKAATRTDSGACTSDAHIKPTNNIEVSDKALPSGLIRPNRPEDIDVSNRPSIYTLADLTRLSIKPQPLSESMKPQPKPLHLNPDPRFSGSGRSDEYDTALQIVKMNTRNITRQRDNLQQKLDELVSGLWRVGFRADLRKRGVLPFRPSG